MPSNKIIILTVFLVVVSSSEVFPLPFNHQAEDHHGSPFYEFGYKVQDGYTGDYKAHQERRVGGFVEGYYTFQEPDGTARQVSYTVDGLSGFNAIVKKTNTPHGPRRNTFQPFQ